MRRLRFQQRGCRECCGKYDNADERHTAVGQACGHELPLFRPPAGLADGLALKELRFDSEESFAPHTWVPRSPPPGGGLGVMRAGAYLLNAFCIDVAIERPSGCETHRFSAVSGTPST